VLELSSSSLQQTQSQRGLHQPLHKEMHQPTQAQGTTNERAQGTTNAQTWEHKQQTNENLLASGWDSSDLGGFRQQQTQDNTQKQGLEFQTQTKRNLPGMKTKNQRDK